MKIKLSKFFLPVGFGALLLQSAIGSASAPAGRYTTASGTVRDTKTGLTWQQPPTSTTYMWSAASSYCTGLGTGWRLPSGKELMTLVDALAYPNSSPLIDTTAFPSTATDKYWWSSSWVVTEGASNWAVDF